MVPQKAGSARMGPLCLLLTAVLLLAQAAPRKASQHCSRLEYWNPEDLCCVWQLLAALRAAPCSGKEPGVGVCICSGGGVKG